MKINEIIDELEKMAKTARNTSDDAHEYYLKLDRRATKLEDLVKAVKEITSQ
jgi:archaellum component FlaC